MCLQLLDSITFLVSSSWNVSSTPDLNPIKSKTAITLSADIKVGPGPNILLKTLKESKLWNMMLMLIDYMSFCVWCVQASVYFWPSQCDLPVGACCGGGGSSETECSSVTFLLLVNMNQNLLPNPCLRLYHLPVTIYLLLPVGAEWPTLSNLSTPRFSF